MVATSFAPRRAQQRIDWWVDRRRKKERHSLYELHSVIHSFEKQVNTVDLHCSSSKGGL